ncbi:MAG: hypothetical protein WCG27_01830 [Pseudomonadota bacterium]
MKKLILINIFIYLGVTSLWAADLLPDPAMGLNQDNIKRYTQTTKVTFKGTVEGRAYETSSTYTRDFWRAPRAEITSMVTSASDGSKRETQVATLGGSVYYRPAADRPWEVNGINDRPTAPSFNPLALLPPVLSAVEVGEENIDGIPAKHYTLNAQSLGLPASFKTTGDLWIALDGYVLKYRYSAQVDQTMVGKDGSGEQTYEYALSKVNATDTPKLPASCPDSVTDLPLLPDAGSFQRSLTFVSYTTTVDKEKIASFYREGLKARGLKELLSMPNPNTLRMIFTDAKREKMVIVTAQPGSSNILVTVSAETIPPPTGLPRPN